MAMPAFMVELWNEIQRDADARSIENAKKDPSKYKLSRLFAGSKSYRYWPADPDGRGRAVFFCWSCHRNIGGYFLSWREIRSKSGAGKRDQFSARKTRKACRLLAAKRREAHNAKRRAIATLGNAIAKAQS